MVIACLTWVEVGATSAVSRLLINLPKLGIAPLLAIPRLDLLDFQLWQFCVGIIV